MPRQNVTAEFKTFVKGIVTEVSPLTFPDNASMEETNFILNRDGSRERRYGLDFEDGYVKHSVSQSLASAHFSAYRWIDGKGVGEGDLIVIQMGDTLKFFSGTEEDITSNVIRSVDLSRTSEDRSQPVSRASYARSGKYLIVTSGGYELFRFTFEDGAVQKKNFRLSIRDFFGVDDFNGSRDLTEGLGLFVRPTSRKDNHLYNLRNQSWGQKYVSALLEYSADPIYAWRSYTGNYPANGDIVTRAVYADTGDSDNRTLEKFWEENLATTNYGSGEPPRGAIILDFVERGASRLEQVNLMESQNGLVYTVESLPEEYEDGSARAVAAYAGRIFYSGFPGGYSENDKSPTTESLVLFSQLIRSGSEFGKCYQDGDPTSKYAPDLLATDGGYVLVEDAFNIHTLKVINAGLLVIAANGVWLISGGSGYSFTADNFLVQRISDKGAISASSVIQADETILYWGEEGIFQVAANQFGDLVATNISKSTIQTLYDDIDYSYKENAEGIFDPYESKIRWVYGERLPEEGVTKELILDTTLGAFSENSYEVYKDHSVIMPVPVPPYMVEEDRREVTVSGETVTTTEGDVYTAQSLLRGGLVGIRYLVGDRQSDSLARVTLAHLSDSGFRDWRSVDDEGVDAAAFMLTGYFSGGDIARAKQAGKLIMYFRRTENGFYEDITTGDWLASNPGSCFVTPMWEWTDSVTSGKWSSPIQTYRMKRQYFPTDLDDEFDNGEPVVVSKSKLRGRGRVLSLKIESEADKDLQILGWAMVVNVDGAA